MLAIIPLYLGSILASAVAALIYRRYLTSRALFVLLPYLIFVFVQETTLVILSHFKYLASNAIVYNIYRPISVLAFYWVYSRIPFMKSLRKPMTLVFAAFLLITAVDYIFIESIMVSSRYLPLLRGFVITFFALCFLFIYFNLDNIKTERFWRPLLWITVGVIVFYPVISISLSFQKQLLALNATINGTKLYNIIPQVMSIFMYSCFCYAFYLCKKIN